MFDTSPAGQNPGTLTNVVAGDWTMSPGGGRTGWAINFDGVDEYIDCGDVQQLNSTSMFSITLWTTADRTDTRQNWIKKYQNNPNHILFSLWNDGNAVLRIANGGTNRFAYFDIATPITLGEWFFIAAVYDGTQSANDEKIRMYYRLEDGDLVEPSLTFNGTLPSTTADLSGQDMGIAVNGGIGSEDYYDGLIDDVRIYGHALHEGLIRTIAKRRGISYEMAPRYKAPEAEVGEGPADNVPAKVHSYRQRRVA